MDAYLIAGAEPTGVDKTSVQLVDAAEYDRLEKKEGEDSVVDGVGCDVAEDQVGSVGCDDNGAILGGDGWACDEAPRQPATPAPLARTTMVPSSGLKENASEYIAALQRMARSRAVATAPPMPAPPRHC